VTAESPLPVARIAELDEPDQTRRWLVDGLWSRAAVGIIGGAPKCKKSWLGLDLAVSVASGTPCLGAFDVLEPGPALLYMAEDDARTVKGRVAGICRHRELPLAELDVHLITAPSLRLDREADCRRLASVVAELAPRILVLDPFVRLHRLDENDAGHISGLLAYLRELQREHDLAVVVVHHARKNGSAASSGQNLRGSGDFHAWVDSSLYLRSKRDHLLLGVEHRSAPAIEPLVIDLVGDEGELHLEIVGAVADDGQDDLASAILAALRERPRTRTNLRAQLRIRNERLGVTLAQLRDVGTIHQHEGLWRVVPDSTP
jgi:hypothetical protein